MRFVHSAVAALFAVGCQSAPVPVPATRQLAQEERPLLLALRDSVWRAWFAGDSTFLRRTLPENFVGIPFGDDTTWATRDKTIADAVAFAAAGGKLVALTFGRDELQSYGDATVILSTYSLTIDADGGRSTTSGRSTELFVREGSTWIHPSWHLDSGR